MTMRYILAVLAYLIPTFALGFVWHLVLFESYYESLAIYRRDIIIPFGFLSMLIQAAIFAWIYERAFAARHGTSSSSGASSSSASRIVTYGLVGAVLSWSFTTLAVAAKNVMTSVPSYLLIETSFTLVQWMMVAPLTVMAFALWDHRDARTRVAG
jgi:hypothetical protein